MCTNCFFYLLGTYHPLAYQLVLWSMVLTVKGQSINSSTFSDFTFLPQILNQMVQLSSNLLSNSSSVFDNLKSAKMYIFWWNILISLIYFWNFLFHALEYNDIWFHPLFICMSLPSLVLLMWQWCGTMDKKFYFFLEYNLGNVHILRNHRWEEGPANYYGRGDINIGKT